MYTCVWCSNIANVSARLLPIVLVEQLVVGTLLYAKNVALDEHFGGSSCTVANPSGQDLGVVRYFETHFEIIRSHTDNGPVITFASLISQ